MSKLLENDRESILDFSDLTITHQVRRDSGKKTSFDAVHNVSLKVFPGEIVGLVGESGSGKTSLSLAVCALGKITQGKITVAGLDLTSLKGRELRAARANVQMVFQDPHSSLDPRQRIGDGLRELRNLHSERVGEITDEELLGKVGLNSGILSRLPNQISGGQAQRVSIVRAMMLNPSLLVADEPTSGLDATVQAQIIELFRSFRNEMGLSILFVSHNLAVVRELCDRAYVMKSGIIVEDGEPASLFENPVHEYTKMLVSAVPGKSAELAKGTR
jgi:ABC-type glutathione transport system ATPase component